MNSCILFKSCLWVFCSHSVLPCDHYVSRSSQPASVQHCTIIPVFPSFTSVPQIDLFVICQNCCIYFIAVVEVCLLQAVI